MHTIESLVEAMTFAAKNFAPADELIGWFKNQAKTIPLMPQESQFPPMTQEEFHSQMKERARHNPSAKWHFDHDCGPEYEVYQALQQTESQQFLPNLPEEGWDRQYVGVVFQGEGQKLVMTSDMIVDVTSNFMIGIDEKNRHTLMPGPTVMYVFGDPCSTLWLGLAALLMAAVAKEQLGEKITQSELHTRYTREGAQKRLKTLAQTEQELRMLAWVTPLIKLHVPELNAVISSFEVPHVTHDHPHLSELEQTTQTRIVGLVAQLIALGHKRIVKRGHGEIWA